jgi:hypothetical protein
VGSVERANKMRELIDRFVRTYSRLPTENDPDYLEMLNMSKYQVSDVPMFKPGKCGNCGSSKNDGRQYVDFGLEIDFYGTLFLCGICVGDVARTMGLFDNLKWELKLAYENLQKLDDLKQEGAALHELVAGLSERLKTYYDGISAAGNYTPSDIDLSVVSNKTATEESVEGSSSEVTGTKPRATKSTSGSGRTNLRSLTDSLNNSTK